MKVNEVPEKIYVYDNVFPNYVDWEGSPINTKRIDNRDIEYTRTDAFIEKVCEFLKTNANKHIYFDECNQEWYDTEELIKDFKDYIKGE